VSVVLLSLIPSSPNVVPLSFEDLNITSPFVFGVPLSVNHTMYTLSPDIAIGALCDLVMVLDQYIQMLVSLASYSAVVTLVLPFPAEGILLNGASPSPPPTTGNCSF